MKLRIGGHPLPLPHIALDTLVVLSSLYLSLWLRLGPDIHKHIVDLTQFAPLLVTTRLISLFGFGVYRGMWRYTGLKDAQAIFKAVGLSALAFFAITYLLPSLGYVPRSLFFIDAIVAGGLLLGVRVLRRSLYERSQGPEPSQNIRKALIVGAGSNGRSLVQILNNDPSAGIHLIGFVDDDKEKQDRRIQGLMVLGDRTELADLIEKTGAQEVILAVTNPSGELLRDVVGACRKFNIQPQIISQFGLRADRTSRAEIYRDVNLNDLLHRQSAEIDYSSVQRLLQGKTVLVTGAGGSIGSELARQIARMGPAKLLLLDHSELSLYEIDKELRLATTDFEKVVPLLIDIKDKMSLAQVFRRYRPEWVFHAAAYKHVHLVESNALSAILNNIMGTKNLVDLAQEIDVEGFVQISTDKAVNPAGVMGATKRVCELLVSSAGLSAQKLYCSVRFGNVLGSSGSLIPLLQKQIREGGPITITHPDMTRYFMLIPEAVSLVLMAATISKPGDISVLKMGEPVKIVDIARSLLALMGKTEEEVPILFTGLRPGEKMFEELYISGKELSTKHPDILTLPDGDLGVESFNDQAKFLQDIESLIALAESGQSQALGILNRLSKRQVQGAVHQGSSTDH